MTSAAFVPSRLHVRRALQIPGWMTGVALPVGPVFAIVALATLEETPGLSAFWLLLAVGASAFAVMHATASWRLVSDVRAYFRLWGDMEIRFVEHRGEKIRGNSELRRFPVGVGLVGIQALSHTAPRLRPPRWVAVFAFAMNLLFGWWSLEGLMTTPERLRVCLTGGERVTPRELVTRVKAHPRPDLRGELADKLRLFGVGLVVFAVLVVVALLYVWLRG